MRGVHVISSPSNVTQGVGLGPPQPNMQAPKPAPRGPAQELMTQLTPEMIEILKRAGVKKRDLNNRQTAAFAISFVQDELKRQEEAERLLQQHQSVVVCSDCDEMYTGRRCPKCNGRGPTLDGSSDGTPGTLRFEASLSRSGVGEVSSPAPAAAAPAPRFPAPRPMARLATERSPRAKSFAPVTSLSRDLDDDHAPKKVPPAGVAPRPPVRPVTPPSGTAPLPPSRKSEVTSLGGPQERGSPVMGVQDRPSPPLERPSVPGSSAHSPLMVGRGRGTGRGLGRGVGLRGSNDDMLVIGSLTKSDGGFPSSPALVEASASSPPPPPPRDDVGLSMPPPPVLPEHVAATVMRRGSVAENARLSKVSLERRSTIGASSGLVPQVTKRPLEQCPLCDEPNEPGYSFCATCGAAKKQPVATSPRAQPPMPAQVAAVRAAPLSRKSAAATLSTPVPNVAPCSPAPVPVPVASGAAAPPAPPPPPPPPAPVSPGPTRKPRDAEKAGGEDETAEAVAAGGDLMAELQLKGKSLKPVAIEKQSKRLSHRNAGQLADALALALAKMRPSFEASQSEIDVGEGDDDDDEW